MATQSSKQYRFGRFVLDPQARELYEDGRLVALAPKVLEALLWLFEHRERAVGRDELGAAIWGTADFSDGQLDRLIWGLRRAIGDSGNERTVIRTVPRFGYRWVADVEPVAQAAKVDAIPLAPGAPETATAADEAPPAAPAARTAVMPERSGTRRRSPRFAFGVLLLLLLFAGAWALHSRHRAASTDAASVEPTASFAAARVAVLPVEMDPGSDSQWAWLRLGLMDLLAARLVQGGVHVVPAHNIIALTGGQGGALPSTDNVREATGASIVIAPSIHRAGDGWRLRLELSGMEGAAREIEVHESEPTATARQAADRVLVMMNRAPVTGRLGEERAGEEETALRINAAVASQRFDVAQQLLDEVPPALRRAPRVRFMGVHVLLQADRTAEALAELEALTETGSDATDADLRSSVLQALGTVLARTGHPADALTRLDSAVEAARNGGSAENYGSALHNRAAANVLLANWSAADADFAQARVAMEMIGDSLGLAELEANEAGAFIKRRRYTEAAMLQSRAIERLERFPAGEALRAVYGNQIAMELELLDTPAALATALRARAHFEKTLPDWRSDPVLALHIGRAELAAGRFEETGRTLLAVRTGLAPTASPERQASVQLLLAQLAFERGDLAEAVRLTDEVAVVPPTPAAAAAPSAKVRSAAVLLRVRALLAQQRTAEAHALASSSAQWASAAADPTVVAAVRLAQALVSARLESPEVAARHFEAALDAASKATPATLARVVVAYGAQLLDAGEIGPATRVVGQVAHWFERDFECALLQARLYHALGQPEPWRQALAAAQRLAGERRIPPALAGDPVPSVAGAASGSFTGRIVAE